MNAENDINVIIAKTLCSKCEELHNKDGTVPECFGQYGSPCAQHIEAQGLLEEFLVYHSLIKELNWYYQNRKRTVMPVSYPDILIEAVCYAANGELDEASKCLDKLRASRAEMSLTDTRR